VLGREHGRDGGGTAAELEHGRGTGRATVARDRGCERRLGLPQDQFGPAAGHEDTRLDDDPSPGEGRPAEDLLERSSRDAVGDHRLERVAVGGLVEQQPRLVLGEDATRGPQASGDDLLAVGFGDRHAPTLDRRVG
jgi:hypothetical protein